MNPTPLYRVPRTTCFLYIVPYREHGLSWSFCLVFSPSVFRWSAFSCSPRSRSELPGPDPVLTRSSIRWTSLCRAAERSQTDGCDVCYVFKVSDREVTRSVYFRGPNPFFIISEAFNVTVFLRLLRKASLLISTEGVCMC